MGIPKDVQQLLLQRWKAGTSHPGTDWSIQPNRYRRNKRGLQRRTEFHRRRVECQERKGTTGNPDELPYSLSGRDDGKLVPSAGNRTCQRWSGGRRKRTRRLPRHSKEDASMVSPCICLCTTLAGRTRYHRLDRIPERNPKELDRTQRRRWNRIQGKRQRFGIHYLHHPCRYHVRRHLHGIGSRKRTGTATYHRHTERWSKRLSGTHQETYRTRTYCRP